MQINKYANVKRSQSAFAVVAIYSKKAKHLTKLKDLEYETFQLI